MKKEKYMTQIAMPTTQTTQRHDFLQETKTIKLLPLVTIVGSILIILGTLLPWITVLGGLQSYSGITGLNGRLLFGAGIFSLIGGFVLWTRQSHTIRWIIGLYGFGILAICGWLLLGLWKTYQTISPDAMVVGSIGSGLFVTTVGAFLIFSTLFLHYKHTNNITQKGGEK